MPLRTTTSKPFLLPPQRKAAGLHLYIIQSNITGAVKIGRSNHPKRRMEELQTGSPHKLRILAVYENRGNEEPVLHQLVDRFRLKTKGEWFSPCCLTELPDWVYERLPFDDDWWRGDYVPTGGSE